MTDSTKQTAGADDAVAGSEQMVQPTELTSEELQEISQKITDLTEQLQQAKESELRIRADYANLQRRSREEHTQVVKLATKALVEDMLEPLEHLSLTAQQLHNSILDMVLGQLWNVLKEHGLEELEVLGKPFNLETMEVVEILDGSDEKTGVITKIVKRGYTLNGKVLQHAKVVIGKKN
jgi:molecular chaperone GrpE